MSEPESVTCPFCNEPEFDRIGLKRHLMLDRCDMFNNTPIWDEPKDAVIQASEILDDWTKSFGQKP